MTGLQYVLIALGSVGLVAVAVLSLSRGQLQRKITIGLVCVVVACFGTVATTDGTTYGWWFLVVALACAVIVREAAVIVLRRSKRGKGE